MPIFFSVLFENTMSNTGNNWRLIAPLVSGFGISMICPMSKKYRNIQKQQPPSYVFKIVWPILYLLLGYSWNKASLKRELDLLHGFITFLLTLWIIVFSCMKNEKYGIFRGTGVLIKKNNKWYITQYNLLLPIPNDLLIDYSKEIKRFLKNE